MRQWGLKNVASLVDIGFRHRVGWLLQSSGLAVVTRKAGKGESEMARGGCKMNSHGWLGGWEQGMAGNTEFRIDLTCETVGDAPSSIVAGIATGTRNITTVPGIKTWTLHGPA